MINKSPQDEEKGKSHLKSMSQAIRNVISIFSLVSWFGKTFIQFSTKDNFTDFKNIMWCNLQIKKVIMFPQT